MLLYVTNLTIIIFFRSILPSFTKKKRRRDSGSDEDSKFVEREEKEDEDLLSDRRRSGRGEGIVLYKKSKKKNLKIFQKIHKNLGGCKFYN